MYVTVCLFVCEHARAFSRGGMVSAYVGLLWFVLGQRIRVGKTCHLPLVDFSTRVNTEPANKAIFIFIHETKHRKTLFALSIKANLEPMPSKS